jgi:tRNA modification GTPase
MDVFDTIAAIATPYGEGGIAVIRVSGPGAFSIVETCFSRSSKKNGSFRDFPSHTIHHGYLCKESALIDEVLVSVFRSPRSYTGEDSVEISCHGGLIVARNVLETVLDAGARLADPLLVQLLIN